MAYQPKKGDVVKITTKPNILRGVVMSYQNPLGRPTVDILIEGFSNYRAQLPIDKITHIDDLNIFDILREKGVLAEKTEEETNG